MNNEQTSDEWIDERIKAILSDEDYKYTDKPHKIRQLLQEVERLARESAYSEAESEIFKDEITYGNHVIPKDWKKIENVYIWFEAFHQGIKWRGIPGYVYKKPDGTFTAPFRGELIDVIHDCKNEYREVAQLTPTSHKGDSK